MLHITFVFRSKCTTERLIVVWLTCYQTLKRPLTKACSHQHGNSACFSCKLFRFLHVKMQFHSLTIGGTCWKAEIQITRVHKVPNNFTFVKRKKSFLFFLFAVMFIKQSNTRIHKQNSWFHIPYLLITVA